MKTLLLSLVVLSLTAAASAGDLLVTKAPAAAIHARVVELVNQARAQGRRCGRERFPPVAPLTVSSALRKAAQHHAQDMARHDFFDHRAPDGSQPKDRVRRAGYQPMLTGENIAFAPESAEEVVAGWLESPGHCANIMDGRFSQIGVGVAEGRQRGHIYWVQNFGEPASAKR